MFNSQIRLRSFLGHVSSEKDAELAREGPKLDFYDTAIRDGGQTNGRQYNA
jgi:hypothetical protein